MSDLVDRQCPTCNGTGRIRFRRQNRTRRLIVDHECHLCRGKGHRIMIAKERL